MNNKRRASIIVGLFVALGIGGGVYAFTASNTVPVTRAGAGSAVVSGYTVTSLHYTLNTTTPVNIDELTFTISPVVPSTGAGKVTIATTLLSGGPNRYTCATNTTGANVTCATKSPQLTATNITGVTVTAAQ